MGSWRYGPNGDKVIAQRVQNGAQHMPRHLPVGPKLGHDLVEPDIGGLQSLVEHVETGGAHVSPPMIAPRFWWGTHGAVRGSDASMRFSVSKNVPASGEIG
jgi:hypothetical protein